MFLCRKEHAESNRRNGKLHRFRGNDALSGRAGGRANSLSRGAVNCRGHLTRSSESRVRAHSSHEPELQHCGSPRTKPAGFCLYPRENPWAPAGTQFSQENAIPRTFAAIRKPSSVRQKVCSESAGLPLLLLQVVFEVPARYPGALRILDCKDEAASLSEDPCQAIAVKVSAL